MKKFITILISCSLTLAASAIAQQQEEQQKPKTEKPETSQPANEATPAPKRQSVRKEHAETKAPGQESGAPKSEATPKMHAGMKGKGREPGNTEANAAGSPTATAEGRKQGKKQRGAANEPATGSKTASPTPASASVQSPAPAVVQSPIPAAAQANTPNPEATQANKLNAKGKKLDPQAVQVIKTQHANFRAQPKPDKVPTVTFNQSYRISGAERWQGEKYAVFRSYRPENHDQGWYHSHYQRVELIGGGYYYWNQGYWYPAWGYDSSAQYYAYDGPIYVGSRAEPPDRVIAYVQATLQQEGYYQGEVDGLLGPLTRQALTAYQSDNGLYPTAAIDEPTLASLDLG